ncbi:MAG TPA: hypothetical protein VFQ47_01910 [Nitrososphaera sp.]|jgi:hypothetical protein|nr:hypothetical protein [Nitrososphaera sp.]
MGLEYERYLNRLDQLIYQEVVPKTAIFDYFTRHLYRLDDKPYEKEPLVWFIQTALYSDITFSIFRLFDRNSDRNIFHFLDYTEKHLSSIQWITPLNRTKINEQRAELAAVSTQIELLRKRRNKFFGHYNKKFFYEPDKVNDDFPFSNEDAITLVRVLQRVISAHMHAFHGHASISIEGFLYVAAEKLYEAIRRSHIT